MNTKFGVITTVALLLVTALVWLALLGARDLIDPDEGRYAEIPREMHASGDWLTPRLNGFKYFEKPPLQYWLTAACYQLLGASNSSARLVTALSGLFGSLWLGFLALRLYDRQTAWYAFLICASGMLYFATGHYLTLDMLLATFLLLALGCLVLAQQNRQQPRQVTGWMLGCWVATAGAVLTKGPVGAVLPGVAVGLYSLWQRDWPLWRHLRIGLGLPVFLLLTMPWYIAVSLANPGFAHFFFIQENLQRYATPIHHHSAPVWFFLPIVVLGCTPWIYHSMSAMIRPGTERPPARHGAFDAERLLRVFVLTVLVFFSLGNAKLAPYILPAMAPLALLAARRLATAPHLAREALLLALAGVTLLVLAIALPRFATEVSPTALLLAARTWALAAAGAFVAGALLLFGWRRRPHLAVATGALSVMLGYQCLFWGLQQLAPSRSARLVAEQVLSRGGADGVSIYQIAGLEPSLAFYLDRAPILVEARGELAMGIDLEPWQWLASPGAFLDVWQSESAAIAVIDNRVLSRYSPDDGTSRVIYQGPRRTVIEKIDQKPLTVSF